MRRDDPFEAMLHRYRGLIFSLCRRYARRGAEVEDLVQEASIALWKAREQLLGLPLMQQAAMVWKVARNAVVDTLRRTPQTETLPEGFEMEGDDRSLLHELHERIALLDEPDRSIVSLQLEGYSYEEIGNQVGMTEKNVGVRLVRIKDKLRKNMAI